MVENSWLFQAWCHYYHFESLQDDGHFGVVVVVAWFKEESDFFLFGTRHFQLFTKDNQKIIR